jgi:hypothetical protein
MDRGGRLELATGCRLDAAGLAELRWLQPALIGRLPWVITAFMLTATAALFSVAIWRSPELSAAALALIDSSMEDYNPASQHPSF